jgi:hypothetical protein
MDSAILQKRKNELTVDHLPIYEAASFVQKGPMAMRDIDKKYVVEEIGQILWYLVTSNNIFSIFAVCTVCWDSFFTLNYNFSLQVLRIQQDSRNIVP